jgi:hypothetical protein
MCSVDISQFGAIYSTREVVAHIQHNHADTLPPRRTLLHHHTWLHEPRTSASAMLTSCTRPASALAMMSTPLPDSLN